jgi:hypothetical protein
VQDVEADGVGFGDHYFLVLEEGQFVVEPLDVVGGLELLPCLGSEQEVQVLEVQVLAQQPTHLHLAPQRVVPEDQAVVVINVLVVWHRLLVF